MGSGQQLRRSWRQARQVLSATVQYPRPGNPIDFTVQPGVGSRRQRLEAVALWYAGEAVWA